MSASFPSPSAPIVARARWALMGIFTLLGIMMSSWLSRLPSIRDALGLNEAEIGLVLLVGALGSLSTVAAAGPLVARFGGLLMMHIATGGFTTALILLTLGVAFTSIPLLSAGIFINGISFALNNVPINVEAAAIERHMGRTVIPQFHAGFSIGALLGTLIGAGASWAQVSVEVQFIVFAVIMLVWRLIAVPRVVLDTLPAAVLAARPAGTRGAAQPTGTVEAPRASRRMRLATALGSWREKRTLMLGFVIMAASLSEGAANDWLSLAVVDGFGKTEAVGALVFGIFVGSMTVFRIAGTRLIDKHGRVLILRLSGGAAIIGLVLFGLAPNLILASFGVALWGFGAALAFPIGIAAASDDPLKAAARVSVVTAFSSMAALGAPPLLGFVAHQIGARYALTLIIVVLLVSVALAGYAKKEAVTEPVVTGPEPDEPTIASDHSALLTIAPETMRALEDSVVAEAIGVLDDPAPIKPEGLPLP